MAFVRHLFRGSLEAQQVNNPPANKENESATHLQGHFLGQEEPLEEVTVTPSSILAWRVPRTDEPGRLQTIGSQSLHRWSDWTQRRLFVQQTVSKGPILSARVTAGSIVTQFTPSQRAHRSRVKRVEWEKVIQSGRDAAVRNKRMRMTRSQEGWRSAHRKHLFMSRWHDWWKEIFLSWR